MTGEGHIEDLAAPYALGALEPAEVEQVLAHIAVCARCRQAVDEALGVTDYLAYAVPVVAPPPDLRARVLAQLPRQRAARQRRPVWAGWPGWWRPAAAVAALSLAIVGAFGIQALRMQQELQTAHQQTQALAPAATQEAQLTGMLLAPQSTAVTLGSVDTTSGAGGRLFINQQQGRLLLVVQQLRPLTDGSVYQVWLSDERGHRAIGTLAPKRDGSGMLALAMPDDFVLYRWLSVTVERTPGGRPAGEFGPRQG